MRLFRRQGKSEGKGGTAVAERPGYGFEGSAEELRVEITRLARENRETGDRDRERRLLCLRHLAGVRMLRHDGNLPPYPDPAGVALPAADPLPEFSRAELTPELVRAGILRDGCVLVRGLVERDRALAFAELIDRSFAHRERMAAGEAVVDPLYEEFDPEPPYIVPPDQRRWIASGGGVLAADAPCLAAEMLDMFEEVGVQRLVEGYVGESPLISLEKTTLRKADPQVAGAWHQDGKFMGDVRALNLWLSLSRCGDESPGLDILPRRLDEILTAGTDEATIDIQISQAKAEEAAGDTPFVRPIFEPGDALLFDDLFLHKTGSDPSMPKPRYAIESWFFGGSAFPSAYAPIAV
jgi:hypothetical protein